MPEIKWRGDISLGQVITILTMLIGATIAWQTIVLRVEANANDIAALAARVDKQELVVQRALSEAQTDRLSQTEILTELRTDMRYLRSAIDTLSKAQRDQRTGQ
jgi:hypothetical protein